MGNQHTSDDNDLYCLRLPVPFFKWFVPSLLRPKTWIVSKANRKMEKMDSLPAKKNSSPMSQGRTHFNVIVILSSRSENHIQSADETNHFPNVTTWTGSCFRALSLMLRKRINLPELSSPVSRPSSFAQFPTVVLSQVLLAVSLSSSRVSAAGWSAAGRHPDTTKVSHSMI